MSWWYIFCQIDGFYQTATGRFLFRFVTSRFQFSMHKQINPYQPKNHIRIVTAASLFDGHDVAINIMRRMMQSTGCEVIHLGHNRSVREIVDCAIQEDVNAIAITSYQGGHLEYFKYMYDLLKERKADRIKIFGGGGGTILPEEIDELHNHGITRIYSPDDGRKLGLQGMINDLVSHCDFPVGENLNGHSKPGVRDKDVLGQYISGIENFPEKNRAIIDQVMNDSKVPILGITGTGGSGKSSLVDELVRRYLHDFSEKTVAVISVDPSKRKTGGALLGDRIRMNSIFDDRVYMRSLATRQSNLALSKYVKEAVQLTKSSGYDLVILETSGIGQSDTEIADHSDLSLYVMTPEYGAASQLEKIDMLDFADVIALNKFDKKGALDALRDVRKQYKRNHSLWETDDNQLPVFGTIASQFNDPGMNRLYLQLIRLINEKSEGVFESSMTESSEGSEKIYIIPPARTRYLSEISEEIHRNNDWVKTQSDLAQKLYALDVSLEILKEQKSSVKEISEVKEKLEKDLDPVNKDLLVDWKRKLEKYGGESYSYEVRGKTFEVKTSSNSLSGTRIPRVMLPKFDGWGDILRWSLQENVPGEFPFTSGVFPFKRQNEDPTRMFAGEGGPERTNKRFHYLSTGLPAIRLSTAFDSVTLYGEDPGHRPDIYGKIGNSGVSICCLDDAKKLYSGFNLCDPTCSVSMTINGPAATITAFFMNAAIDQQCEIYIKENGLEEEVKKKIDHIYKGKDRPVYRGDLPSGHNGLGLFLLGVTGDEVLPDDVYQEIKKNTLSVVRGTVQADILKEDQAQNTCIFSTEFSLKLMGDVQQFFIDHHVKNFYSVSISGYHIAEAGANPITQLAFTLANGFTYVEYYLARGMQIDDFAPNLSFFFSNGVDAEYAVIGRVARRIWAKAMKMKYGANERSQKLKYHIQTSGRSLHAQEIDFNDIRTTLQALYAIYDNCNSLHTNAYDEAITTPTEDSVRRALAIQMIINKELGLAKNENPMQGSFIIEELTDLVEEAVMKEFDRITERGGVLGAMESMYQRGKIQEESLFYEGKKHSGELPIVGVNTFLSSKGSPTVTPGEVIRAKTDEKESQIHHLSLLHERKPEKTDKELGLLKTRAIENGNVFDQLMEATKWCSLGQITHAMYEVGGQYRRNV